MAVAFPRQSPIFLSEADSFKESFDSLPKSEGYATHMSRDGQAASLYQISQEIITLWKISLQFLAHVIEPLPGACKDSFLIGVAIRIASFAGLCMTLPFGLVSLIPGLPLYFWAHTSRPYISVIDNSNRVQVGTPKETLDVRTYNLGFVHETMRIVGDLRSVAERANEIGDAILQEENSPDVICFQEAFHQDGTEILCNKLKEKYPYIIHSVAPHGIGFPSGKIIASKYKIEEVSFRILSGMVGPERMAPRGLLGVRLDLGNGKYANVYNAHMQSLLGRSRAAARVHQLREIITAMDNDHAADLERRDVRTKVGDFLMGDLNLSLITAWGEENPGEQEGAKIISDNFHEYKGSPTWYVGPFANRGLLFRLNEWIESVFCGFKAGNQVVPMENPPTWGTSKWTRAANTATFDYQLVRKRDGMVAPQGRCVTEHVPTKAQSAPSDHLPLRAIYNI